MEPDWNKLRETYERHGIPWSEVSRDGRLDPASFGEVRPRVVFVLKETNDFAGGELQELLAKGPRFRMWYTVARWAAGLLDGFPPYDEIDKYERMRDALHKVAVVNLKKVTGGSSSWSRVIHAAALRDKTFLRKQLHMLDPDVIVACGTFEPLMWLLELPVDPQAPKSVVKWPDQGALVIPFRHPARCNNRSTYAHLAEVAGGHVHPISSMDS